jgi:hypothetical protein
VPMQQRTAALPHDAGARAIVKVTTMLTGFTIAPINIWADVSIRRWAMCISGCASKRKRQAAGSSHRPSSHHSHRLRVSFAFVAGATREGLAVGANGGSRAERTRLDARCTPIEEEIIISIELGEDRSPSISSRLKGVVARHGL